nr:hypothetical protein [Paucibacter sp. M5-1]MCZ7884463.1 hypothetical protein [Paucibacter sp. M5-1]
MPLMPLMPGSQIGQIQPGQFLGAEIDIEAAHRAGGLGDAARADQAEGGEAQGQHPGQRDIDRSTALLGGQLAGPRQAQEIGLAIPAAHQLLVVLLARRGAAVDEEAARLRGPGEQRQALLGQPAPRVRRAGRDTAAPDRRLHTRQAQLVVDQREALLAGTRRIGIRLGHPRQRPVAAAKGLEAALVALLVERVDELADRHLGVVAVQDVEVGRLGAQALQAFGQLARHALGRAVRRVGALGDQHDLVADAARAQPVAEDGLAVPALEVIDPGGVEGIAAALQIVVEQRGRIRQGLLVVHPHDQA